MHAKFEERQNISGQGGGAAQRLCARSGAGGKTRQGTPPTSNTPPTPNLKQNHDLKHNLIQTYHSNLKHSYNLTQISNLNLDCNFKTR